MTETGERVCCSESLKLQSGYALLPFQTLRSISALVGIHLKKEKSCLKKRPTPGADDAVYAYKSLSTVERAFRSIKTTSLQVRPIYVYSENHVRGHVFLCMLAYYLEWHLRQRLAPLMFEDDDREGAKKRSSPVEKAEVSDSAKRKYKTKRTEEGFCVHSFRTLMEDLATLSLNEVTLPGSSEHRLHITADPTALQQRAFELLDVDRGEFVASTGTG